MSERAERYTAFDKFYEESQALFESYAKSSPDNSHLARLYSLCICPGGRYGGLNRREVEIFYGNRPFDSVTKVGDNLQKTEKLETAHGATLSYQRTDDGQVLCCLYPAASENFRPPEDFILLGLIKNPADLERESKKHWKFFLSYMQVTCLDGKPNTLHKVRVFFLRNFKECVVDKTLQKRKASKIFGEIAKFTATVGLSGFIILLVTWSKESFDSKKIEEERQELLSIYSSIERNAKATAENSAAIQSAIQSLDQNMKTEIQVLSDAASKNTARIEDAISQQSAREEIDKVGEQDVQK